MEVKIPDTEIGVIIGRFQVPTLHDGHIELIDFVKSRHQKVLILVGSTPGILVTRHDPLDYHTRMLMIKEVYPAISVLPVHDMPSDRDWSRVVDQKIAETFSIGTPLLYGSRDGFIPHYEGKHQTVELSNKIRMSGTKVRKECSNEVRLHEEFRRGVIYAAFNKYPAVYSVVDVAAMQGDSIALGRKKNDPKNTWRFPGGFADPTDDNLLRVAQREAREELGDVELADWNYVGSTRIDDWRYKSQVDSLMSTVFIAKHVWGNLHAGDDLFEAKWFDLKNFNENLLLKQHLPILRMVKKHLNLE
ncbi:MAG: NUDIX domain-containing protein [Candidatus Thorarchaeota archaeon]